MPNAITRELRTLETLIIADALESAIADARPAPPSEHYQRCYGCAWCEG